MNLLAADLVDKLYTVMWPLARISAALMTVPLLSLDAANPRIRFGLALALTLMVWPLHDWPVIEPASARGLATLFNQIAIGTMTGLSLQVITSATVVAGQAISSSMGLSLANLIDPSLGNVPVVSQLLLIVATLIFLALGGHLVLVGFLVESFRLLPVGSALPGLDSVGNLLRWSSMMFLGGVMIALPILALLMIVNIGLGVVTRAAPSLNIFVVGVPFTIAVGFLVLVMAIPAIGARIEWLWLRGFEELRILFGAV